MEIDDNINEVPNDCDMETEKHTPKRKRIKTYTNRGVQSLRTEHCSRLSRLLGECLQQRNWKDASGILSVLLKGTVREKFPKENRDKYLAAMELLKKMEDDRIKPTYIQRVYKTWMEKNGAMKKCPAKDKFSTELEYVLFCLTHGDIDDATEQAMTSLMQVTEYGCDPMLNMIVGLIYYELWYACIPKEMKLKSSDIVRTPMLSELSGWDSYHPVESTGCNSVDDQDVESPARGDSTSSIGNDKNQPINSGGDIKRDPSDQVFQPRGFYIDESGELSGNKEANRDENLMGSSIFRFRGLDVSLLPLRLPDLNQEFGNSIDLYMEKLNDNYHKAVKHLQFALHSTPPVSAALLPLVQLLLLGDQVEEVLKELENICRTSNAVLPFRIRAILVECFDANNPIRISACYEDVMKKDPQCSISLSRLIAMHKNGDYGLVQVLEMVGLHLDATYAGSSIWRELASCFLKLSHYEEDQMSMCGNENGGVDRRHPTLVNTNPTIFSHGKSKKSWELRCRWWSTRYFRRNAHVSEMEAGEWELLSCKAACASHLYGPEFGYVVSVVNCLEKEEKWDEILFLQLHMKESVNVSELLKREEIILDDHTCFSN